MFTYPTKVRSPSGITIIAVLITAYLIFASTTPVQGAQWFYQTNLLPPENGMYNCTSPSAYFAVYPSGFVIRNFSSRQFTQSIPPPPSGAPVTVSFNSKIEMEISFDGGSTYWPIKANAANTMWIQYQSSSGGEDIYKTEMLQLDISGGDLPSGVMIRESPTLASIGQIHIKPVAGGYMIDSFFDIFTEISTDFGGSWMPSSGSGRLELKVDPAFYPPVAAPRTVLPMPNGEHASLSDEGQAYANNIIIKNIRQKLFTSWEEPPTLGLTHTHTCDLQIDFDFSSDGGSTFSHCRSPAVATETIKHTRDFQGRSTYETEMTQCDISGGDLPLGVRFRESPTKVSEGGVSMLAGGGGGGAGGGAAISSFFDIFTEVSTDGGVTWWPATSGPEHLELERVAPVYTYANNLWPPLSGEYLDKGGWFAFYPNGIVISNVHQHGFTASIVPPLPGYTTSHTFGEQVDLEVSYDGGLTFTRATAPATVTVQITCRLGDDGTTEYYDTEMTRLDISGGTLLAGVQIRESPTRASLGRTTSSSVGGGTTYQVDSFFDIYTEVSNDGGMSWYPTFVGPGTVYLRPVPCEKCSDLDGNSVVNMSDLEIFVANWLWKESVGQTDNVADLNCDEKVDFRDYAILAEIWLQGCQ
ncbi:MAG: dockerin type I domain-containing protein [Sedimentisphaerales bacterium]